MSITGWLRRLCAYERGANVVEYVGVTGIALLLAGMLIVGVMNGRYTIGGVMAGHIDRIISSFEGGRPGTANTNTSLYPHLEISNLDVTLPQVSLFESMPAVVVGVPRVVNWIDAPAERPAAVVAPAAVVSQAAPTSIGTADVRGDVVSPALAVPQILLPVVGVPAIVDR
jgi:hypothetical protein